MDPHSEPVAAAAAYDLVISDELLSAESEVAAVYEPREITREFPLVSTTLPTVGATQSMENVLLDYVPMEESIDLGNDSILDRSAATTSSTAQLEDQTLLQTDDIDLTIDSVEPSGEQADKINPDHVQFDDTMSPSGETESKTVDTENLSAKNQENLLTQEEMSDQAAVRVCITDVHSGFDRLLKLSDEHSSEPDDACEVEFVEVKGLRVAESSRSLCKFFENEDNAGGTDVEGKSFFDSFTTGDEDPITPAITPSPRILESTSALPSLSTQHVSLSSSLSSAGATPSPVHRISDSSSPFALHTHSSINEGCASDADPFSSGMFTNDVDRRHDAWIPSETTRVVLVAVVTSSSGTPVPSHRTCSPHIILDESLGDPVYELVTRLLGEQQAAKRLVLSADSVPQDEIGLRQLIKAECYRAAVELTRRLLTACGQGADTLGQPALHSAYSIQLWFSRLSLLVKLGQFTAAEAELDQFADLDSPDRYHDYYMSASVRRGSLVPFDMRVLHAELAQHNGKAHETVDRLCHLRTVISQMLTKLDNGLAEDGSILELNETSLAASRELWRARETRVMYALGNCLLAAKNYTSAVQVYRELTEKDVANKANLLSGLGRIYLQLGDISVASGYFVSAEAVDSTSNQNLLNKGLLQLANSNFTSAYELFKKLTLLDSHNVVAVNNLAVCSVYVGRLKEALYHLDTLVQSDPARHLHEGIVLNLCTLYELESSRAVNKKHNLLSLVALHKGDAFNVTCLKLT